MTVFLFDPPCGRLLDPQPVLNEVVHLVCSGEHAALCEDKVFG
jgi:hypothetical protein